MPVSCVLCGESGASFQEEIDIAHLNEAYTNDFGVMHALPVERLEYYKCLKCGLGFFDPIVPAGEELYEHLQEFDWYYMADKYEYSIAMKYLPDFATVLEVGAGKAAFANLVGFERYTGLEFNDKAIERALSSGVSLLKQSVEEHASCGHSYDAVVSFQVLEHVPDPAGFIRGCLSCLKPGGVLMLAVPANDGFSGVALNHVLDLPPHHMTRWSDQALRNLEELFGLELLNIEYEPVAEYHRRFASKTIREHQLRNMLGFKNRLVDFSLSARLISKLASVVARVAPVDVTPFKGHTVIAVYKNGSRQ